MTWWLLLTPHLEHNLINIASFFSLKTADKLNRKAISVALQTQVKAYIELIALAALVTGIISVLIRYLSE